MPETVWFWKANELWNKDKTKDENGKKMRQQNLKKREGKENSETKVEKEQTPQLVAWTPTFIEA